VSTKDVTKPGRDKSRPYEYQDIRLSGNERTVTFPR